MLAVLLALASAVGYGGSDYAGGLAARRAGVIRITILAQAVSADRHVVTAGCVGHGTLPPCCAASR